MIRQSGPGYRVGVDVGRRLTKLFVAGPDVQSAGNMPLASTAHVCESVDFLRSPLTTVKDAFGQLHDIEFTLAACSDEVGLQCVSAMEQVVGDGRLCFVEESIAKVAAALADQADRLSQTALSTVCHVDVGAHSISAQVFRDGRLIDAASLEIGASFMLLSADGTLLSLSEAGETFLDGVAKKAVIGERLEPEKIELLSMLLGEVVAHFLNDKRPPQLPQRLLATEKLKQEFPVSQFLFSGGVFALPTLCDQLRHVPQHCAPTEMPHAQLVHGDVGPILKRCILESMGERQLAYSVSGNPLFARASGLLQIP